jgi:Ser-tRNA(Ala) deacylase AlaX
VTRLRIVRVPVWNINCCNERHVESTLQVGRLKLGTPRYRNSKKELEVEFDLVD